MSVDPWNHWTEGLIREIRELGEFKAITIEFGPPVYIQVMRTPGRIAAQAVSNEFLPEELRLSPQDQTRMAELGWTRPNDGQPNWHTATGEPEEPTVARNLAQLITATLRTVYRAPAPSDVRIVPFDVLKSQS